MRNYIFPKKSARGVDSPNKSLENVTMYDLYSQNIRKMKSQSPTPPANDSRSTLTNAHSSGYCFYTLPQKTVESVFLNQNIKPKKNSTMRIKTQLNLKDLHLKGGYS